MRALQKTLEKPISWNWKVNANACLLEPEARRRAVIKTDEPSELITVQKVLNSRRRTKIMRKKDNTNPKVNVGNILQHRLELRSEGTDQHKFVGNVKRPVLPNPLPINSVRKRDQEPMISHFQNLDLTDRKSVV